MYMFTSDHYAAAKNMTRAEKSYMFLWGWKFRDYGI